MPFPSNNQILIKYQNKIIGEIQSIYLNERYVSNVKFYLDCMKKDEKYLPPGDICKFIKNTKFIVEIWKQEKLDKILDDVSFYMNSIYLDRKYVRNSLDSIVSISFRGDTLKMNKQNEEQ